MVCFVAEAGRYFDHLYIKFYNDFCHTGAGRKFDESLEKWLEITKIQKPKGPLIFVGLPSSGEASSGTNYYQSPDELATMYKVCQEIYLFWCVARNMYNLFIAV